jgi:DNA-binding helix-hairpin-helix protein with protein kinase domain
VTSPVTDVLDALQALVTLHQQASATAAPNPTAKEWADAVSEAEDVLMRFGRISDEPEYPG